MSEEILERLSSEYGIGKDRLKVYYNETKEYEFFDEEKAEEFLENVCLKIHVNKNGHNMHLSKNDICDALYRTFGDDCLAYLPKEYIYSYGIDDLHYEHNSNDDTIDLVTTYPRRF